MSFEDTLTIELKKLVEAADKMCAKIYPNVPVGRPRKFELCYRVSWPYIEGSYGFYDIISIDGRPYMIRKEYNYIVKKIVEETGGQSQKLRRVLRLVRAAKEWCLKRAEGRRRASQEILRQQSKALEALRAEAVLNKLSK